MIWILHCKPWSDFATTYEKFVENKKTTNEYKIKRKSKTSSMSDQLYLTSLKGCLKRLSSNRRKWGEDKNPSIQLPLS